MKKNVSKKILCLILMVTLTVGFTPTIAFAGYEDGIECEFCGGYRFDDWVCDDGPHCSDSSGASDCYYENHCAECLGPVENSERCDTCYICPDCMNDGVILHCAICGACDEGGYDVCDDCDTCMNCQIDAGTHCFECGDCLESGSQCPDHPFEMYQENHCESCALKCSGCDDKCFLGETFIDIYCEEHELCVVCATDDGLHCKECYGCYEDELCSECQKCDECGLESGEHCPECDAHGEDWCEDGGEGTHCVECATEFLCEQCNGCTSCNGTEFCDECGLCIECCVENAQSENCSCGEYCIDSGNWEDHFCESCGNCFDEYEQCEYCGLCSDCCESESECSSGMCVEDPDYEEHFCSECNQCFDDVQLCEDCGSVGELTCMDCCRDRTQQMNCEHDICVNHWEWSEHYCETCQTCFDLCEHLPIAHEHDYDDFDKCKICGASRSGAPCIIHQPTDVTCNVTDINDLAKRGLNKVTFRVKASGENLTYQWVYKDKDGITRMAKDTLSSGYDDCVLFDGSTTDPLTVWVKPDACNVIYEFGCGIVNSKGRVESELAKLNAKHVYGNVKPVLGDSATISYWNAEKLTVDSITYNLSSGHVQNCVGDGCGEALAEVPHRFSSWKQGAEATSAYTGYKSRECIDCGYVDYEVLPVLKEAHVHDYSYGYAQGDVYHWKQCVCAEKDMESREVHTFGEWTVTKPATMTANGEEQRTCTTCEYVEKRSTERQGHTHIFYDWDYISANGHIVEDGVEVPPFMGDYGKTTRSNHYAYCIVEGCNEVKKEAHNFGATKWITYPTETADGVWYKLCGSCGYQYDGTAKAGRCPIINTNCKVNMQNALPGATVKVTPYEKYDKQYFSGKIFAKFTTDLGNSYTYLEVNHHTPDASDDKDYYYFTYPEVPDGVAWTDVWVEVSPQLKKCTHRISLQNVVEATCGEAGYTGDMMCEFCTYVESAGSTIPSTGEHGDTYLSGKRNGTCTRKGYSGDIKCCDCDKIIEKGKPTDYYHENTKTTISPLPATCTSEGHTYESVCLDCGKVLNESRVISKMKHRWERFLEVPATCTTKGMKAHYQCTVCNRYSEDRENWFVSNRSLIIPSLGGHNWSDATCAAPKTCTVCKETEGEKLDTHKTNIVKYGKDNHWTECVCGEMSTPYEKHQLSSSWTVDKKATTNAAGSRHKSCDCGYVLTEAIPQISNIKLSDTSYLYSGEAIKPGVDIRDMNNGVLKEGTDYSLKYENNINAGTGKVTITFKGDYEGTVTKNFTINKRDITKWMSSLSYTTTTYNGSAKKPTVTLKNSSNVVLDDEHYTVTYTNNVNAGTATVAIKGKDNYTGTITKTFTINKASISGKSASLSYTSTTYDGTAKKPTVKISGLTKDKDYTVAYKNNTSAGTATVTITGKGNYSGTITKTFTINKASMTGIKVSGKEVTYNAESHTITVSGVTDGAKVYYKTSSSGSYSTTKPSRTSAGTTTVYYKVSKTNYKDVTGSVKIKINKKKISEASLSKTSYVYNGEVKKPTVTVKAGTLTPASKISKSNGNVTIKYADGRKNVGKYKVTITGKGNYTGTITKTFKINPKATKITSLTKGDNAFTVKWEKRTTQTTGYQIYYTTSSTRKNGKTVTIYSNKTTSKKISKLKNNKKYYVWARTYKTVNGVKYFSTWSAKKVITTK